MKKDKSIKTIEIHEGVFEQNQIKRGRIITETTIMIGNFNNQELDGYGKKVLPNLITKEGIFKNGSLLIDC